MPSSISSSEAAHAPGHAKVVWLSALVVALSVLAGIEGFWRSAGHRPSVSDDVSLWMLARSRVKANDPSEVVLIGASRVQQAIDPKIFAKAFGGDTPVQLAVGGTTMIPVLDHLSRDETFRGIVIVDAVPFLFYPGGFSNDGEAGEFVRRYETATRTSSGLTLALLERRLRTLVQERLVLRLPELAPSLSNIQRWVEARHLPVPSGRVTLADRSQKSDYRGLDPEVLDRTKRLWVSRIEAFGHGPSAEELQAGLRSVETMVNRIQQRGGRVVFVNFPVSGIVRAAEEEHQPRAKYWDVLAAHTTALTIHFDDYSALASFECAEGSHLDYRDAERFTVALAKILNEKLRTS